jgi:replicative DNA helicase
VPFVMRAIGQSAEWCAKGITAMVREHGIQVVICDYLQRFKTDRKLQDRRNEVTYALGTLSDAIKNSGAAGLILSQLKRTDGKVPTMEDLKESGDIEIMTETVLLGHRTPRARDTRDMSGFTKYDRSLYVPKNKFGPVMADTPIDLEFDEVSASFQGEKNDQHYSAASAPMPNWTDHN